MCENFKRDLIGDTGRIIRKFDIYVCDFGDQEDYSGSSIGKVRPGIILSSDNINNVLQNQYIVAPIRTEHSVEVTEDNLAEIIEMKRNVGRYYTPIFDYKDGIRFIDMGQIRQIPSCKVLNYVCSIVKEEAKRNINRDLAYILFTKDELQYASESDNKCDKEQKQVKTEIVNTVNKESKRSHSTKKIPIPINFPEVYNKVKSKCITIKEATEILNISTNTYYRMKKTYESVSNAQKLNVEVASKKQIPDNIPTGFSLYFKKYQSGTMTVKQISQRLNRPECDINNYINYYKKLQYN